MNPAIRPCSFSIVSLVSMKKTLLLSNHYEGIPLEILTKAVGDRFRFLVLDRADREELLRMVPEADYLLVSGRLQIDREVIEKAGRLRMVQRTGVGLDNMDLACLKEKGIPLFVNRGVNAISVAEHTLMLMLGTLKRAYAVNLQMRQGGWKKQATGLTTRELSGKTIGIIGAGSIGQAVIKLLSGFQVDILYYDPYRLPSEKEEELGITYMDLEDLLAQADLVSLHCAYDPEKGYVIAERELSLMKDGAVLINTARGRLVKEAALITALESGKLSACGIDTFEEEPPAGVSRLASYDQVLLSPHVAGVSYEAFSRMMELAADNIALFDQGKTEEIKGNRIV